MGPVNMSRYTGILPAFCCCCFVTAPCSSAEMPPSKRPHGRQGLCRLNSDARPLPQSARHAFKQGSSPPLPVCANIKFTAARWKWGGGSSLVFNPEETARFQAWLGEDPHPFEPKEYMNERISFQRFCLFLTTGSVTRKVNS